MIPLLALASFLTAEYQLCFLSDGPNSGKIEAARAKELQTSHMRHIGSMWKSGALESAGPVSDYPGVRGIFLFDVSKEEAENAAAKDPKVLAGDLKVECATWLGPANVGKAYRAAYGKPGFEEKYTRLVGVLLNEVRDDSRVGAVKAAGALKGGKFGYFVLLETDRIETVRKKMPKATAFLWMHDPQVWKGVQ